MTLSEKQKMLSGELYDCKDPELVDLRFRARRLMRLYNTSTEDQLDHRQELLSEILGHLGPGVWIEPPFYFDYGSFIELGDKVYLNVNCVILDCNRVRIGDQTMLGPSVQIYAAYHPIDAVERCAGPEYAAPVTIGRQSWIGGGAIICQGVSIGDRTTIGAGSVVTKDIPSDVFAAGNPCRVIRSLNNG
jgi:maltose O-acetyltransferase